MLVGPMKIEIPGLYPERKNPQLNATFTSLFKLCEREKENFLNQFCDAKDMRKSLLRVLLKFRYIPALAKLAGNILVDMLTGRK